MWKRQYARRRVGEDQESASALLSLKGGPFVCEILVT